MTGLGTVVGLQWRSRRHALSAWVVGMVLALLLTALAVASLYDTPAAIAGYAASVSGAGLVAINGRVEGLASLGGIVEDEFAFLAAFLLPLFGISLVAATRREEETGRLELLLARRVDRRAPLVAALAVGSASVVVTVVGFVVTLLVAGIAAGPAVLYALSLGLLATVFGGLAALLTQVALHTRTVYAGGLAVLLLAYVLRGAGDVSRTWVAWLSPLTWAERTAPFGARRWWVLGIPLVVTCALAGLAVAIAGRRDLGSALLRGHAGPPRAGRLLREPAGLAARIHRGSTGAWVTAAVAVGGAFGILAKSAVDAAVANPGLASALGSRARPEDAFLGAGLLYLAMLSCGYAVQAAGTLRREEVDGRLEPLLAGTISRSRWARTQAATVVAGLVLVTVAGSVTFALTAAASIGDASLAGTLLRDGVAYLPAALLVAAVALLVYAAAPRAVPAVWAAFGVVLFVAILGPGLRLPGWVLHLAPTTAIGSPPTGRVEPVGLAVLTVLAVALGVLALAAFRRRAIPVR